MKNHRSNFVRRKPPPWVTSYGLDTAKKPLQTGYQHFKTLKNGQGIAPGGSNFEKIFLNCCANQLSTQIFQYTSPEIKNKALNQPVFVSSDP